MDENRDWVLRAETSVLSHWEKFTVIPQPTVTPSPTPIVLVGVVRVQSWVYSSPQTDNDKRAAFVMEGWLVDVVDSSTDGEGTEWYYITWVQGDSRGSGWIEAERIEVMGTK